MIFTAENGKDALNLIQNKNIEIDLLFTDMIMPDMNGKELSKKLKEILPDVNVLFASGYVDNNVIDSGELEKNINQLTTAVAHEIQYSSGIADMVSTNLLFNDDKERIYSVLDKYKSISDEELKNFAGEYIQMGREIEIECLPEPDKSA